MSRSSRKKDNYGNRGEFPHDDRNEGTAARTRPFSFDEIMLQRKNKKQSLDTEEKISEIKVDKNLEPEDVVTVSSRNREDQSSIKDVKSDKIRLRSVVEKSNPHIEGKRKNDEFINSRDFVVKEKCADRSRGKSEKEMKKKSRYEDDERYIERDTSKKHDVWSREKHDERSRERDAIKKHDERSRERDAIKKHDERSRERDATKKHDERSRERDATKKHDERSIERDTTKKHDERSRERDAIKKHESRRWQDSEFPEKKAKKESSSLQKRRRSRSRDHHNDKDKGRRSVSLSPRAHKRTSFNGKGSPSRLGGYSPRKRRTEAAIKTPSPTNHRSPEKKSATWDNPTVAKENNFSNFVISNVGSSKQAVSESVSVGLSIPNDQKKPPVGILSGALSSTKASVDSIQLTQATRPMRRLYVENLPASISEEALKDCLNDLIVSSGVNLIQGTKPCISCIINKEKAQALAEFLTPEDATNALSFNGRSFSGSVLKIRRPKDFVDVSARMTGDDPNKSAVAAPESVSDIVQDSHHKIFIGSVSKLISSEMLKEIASAYGRLKAYRFEVDGDSHGPCAFLEYADEAVTAKACAGLNGMKLGGQLLTVVQAIPNASPIKVENIGILPLHGVPEHAKPLLKKPTQVLKLKNLLDPSSLSSLSETELEEILQDVRLECARFGTVKSVNVVKHSDSSPTLEEREIANTVNPPIGVHNLICDDKKTSAGEKTEELDIAIQTNVNSNNQLDIKSEPSTTSIRPDDQSEDNIIKDEILEQPRVNSIKDPTFPECSSADLEEPNTSTDEQNHEHEVDDKETEIKPWVTDEPDKDGNSNVDENKEGVDHQENFEVGCILVEYKRVEACSTAAHCLHGRLFDSRIVMAEYVDHDLYMVRFPK